MRAVTLGQLCQEGGIQTGPFGSQLHAHEYSFNGIPVVMPQDLGDNRIEPADIARVPELVAARLPKHRLELGDIVYSRRGDVERRALVRADEGGWLCGTGCLRVRIDPVRADARFISYALGHADVRQWIVNHAVGATMPNLNTSILAAVPLDIPPLSNQRAIADVLGALDDKIAANDAFARAAEELLVAQFRQMQCGSDARLRSLGEVVDWNPSYAAPIAAEPTYVDMQKLPTVGSQIGAWARRPAKGGARFTNGDTLLARITPCLENRKTGFVNFLQPGEVGLGSTEFVVLRSRPGFAKPLSYFVAIDEGFRRHAIQNMVGTSGRQRVSVGSLAEYEMTLPEGDALADFGRRSELLFERLGKKRDESNKLAELRDTLLPHLMSGRLTVREGLQQVEQAL